MEGVFKKLPQQQGLLTCASTADGYLPGISSSGNQSAPLRLQLRAVADSHRALRSFRCRLSVF